MGRRLCLSDGIVCVACVSALNEPPNIGPGQAGPYWSSAGKERERERTKIENIQLSFYNFACHYTAAAIFVHR